MKNIFIELTEVNGERILVNVLHIAWIEPYKGGSIVKSNMVHYALSKKVNETYDQIKALISKLDLAQ
jgi:uncharacterized protein YlzI (FlbEa/FlbD family)